MGCCLRLLYAPAVLPEGDGVNIVSARAGRFHVWERSSTDQELRASFPYEVSRRLGPRRPTVHASCQSHRQPRQLDWFSFLVRRQPTS